MSTANEEELQHMVDIYLQLNNNNTNSSRTSDSPSGEKNAGNQTKLTSELKRPNRASSRRASLKAASEAVPEAVIVDDEEEHAPKPPADDEGLVHKAPVVSSIKEEEAVDGEVEDYVYDVYYREKMLGSTWEGGQYGLLLYNTEQDFEDLIFDENDDGDNSDYGLSDDEDSNAEDYYGNDYPDEEDFEEEEDEETEFVSEGRSGLGAEAEEGGEAEIDADDFDGYEYEECAPRFADDDGDRSMEGGVGLQDIMELEDSAESDSDFAERILSSLRQKDGLP
ncbi:hypothetical protein BZA70DRAFT_189616 [Myxozyma melibiosi]|uniref:Transcription factor Iwr1 domain-containing protein n=1 Tax=Myxozyma melibiosi TaxID=54550 RepID=A0ABR1F5C4_9ASCO